MPLDLPAPLWLPSKPAIIRPWKTDIITLASFLPGGFPAAAGAGAPAPPTTFQFVDSVHDLPANQDPQSQTLDWGAEPGVGETRHILVALAFLTASTVAPDSCTVGGTAATNLVNFAPAGTIGCGFWIVEKPTGTSGTVEFGVPSGDIDQGAIATYACYNLQSAAARDSATQAATVSPGVSTLDVDTLQGGAVFAVAHLSNAISQSINWTGITEDSANETTNVQHWFASAFDTAAASPRAIQAVRAAGGGPVSCSVSLR